MLARVDLSALFPEPAATYVEQHGGAVLRSQRVTAIDPLAAGFEIEAGGQRQTFSHVICALSPHQVNAFLIGITALSDIAATIERLQYQPIHSVWLQYPASVPLPSPMLGLTGGLIHWVFDREKLCGQRGLVGAVISAEGEHQELDQDSLGLRVHQELKQLVRELPDPLWTRVIAEKRATFACMPGRPAATAAHAAQEFLSGGRLHGERLPGDHRIRRKKRHHVRAPRSAKRLIVHAVVLAAAAV